MSPDAPRKQVQLLAAAAAVLPMAALTAWMYGLRDAAPGLSEFFLGPLLIGGGMIFWLLLLHVVVCRDSLQGLGFRVGGLWKDVVVGVALGVGLLILKILSDPVLSGLFEARPPSEEAMTLIFGIARDPLLLALWLGPVVWIGIAGFEELWRVVVLRRLWIVFTGTAGRWCMLLLVSALVGLAHGYQGPAAVISIAVKSVIVGWYFMATGRARPLIVGHAVYDSLQIVAAVSAIRAT